MKDKCFLDSNLLIYSIDEKDPEKREHVQKFLDEIDKIHVPVISTQTIGEFFNVTTRKLRIPKENSMILCNLLKEKYPIYEISVENVYHALKISERTQFSYWDSLILAVAIDTGCTVVYSEDLNAGQIIEGVKIINPFSNQAVA